MTAGRGLPPVLVHASALVVGTTGIAITGPSGVGKSALALHLLRQAADRGLFARLVADDQVSLTVASGRVLMRPPASIAGLMEVRGSGVLRVPFLPQAVLHLVLAPAEPTGADRVPAEAETIELVAGRPLPLRRMLYRGEVDPLAALALLQPRL